MCGVIASTVESFFAWRTYQFSRFRILASVIIVLALAQLVASVVSSILEKEVRVPAANTQGAWKNAAIIWLSCAAAADVLIAFSMVILLLRRKSGVASTNAMIDRLVRMIVETGTLAVIVLAYCGSLHETLLYEAPYSNTFLTNLNSRNYVRKHDQHVLELSRVGGRRSTLTLPLAFGEHSVMRPSTVTTDDTQIIGTLPNQDDLKPVERSGVAHKKDLDPSLKNFTNVTMSGMCGVIPLLDFGVMRFCRLGHLGLFTTFEDVLEVSMPYLMPYVPNLYVHSGTFLVKL
ncbi:hypothetical protein WOLCODRAFT_17546 [Wolfiporia cocos MD-104 SS10]|uniref:DUF6534 domain-containing protein n=1 Tax=Wolfiporia cocos (strain MD-104) TaxID=742152 RepID=A0A2H3JWF4_WOLCO|nr:hypothetical protein WOLCODRAFT_17546 [Wolfiporia cocos MD-104 SS10]